MPLLEHVGLIFITLVLKQKLFYTTKCKVIGLHVLNNRIQVPFHDNWCKRNVVILRNCCIQHVKLSLGTKHTSHHYIHVHRLRHINRPKIVDLPIRPKN